MRAMSFLRKYFVLLTLCGVTAYFCYHLLHGKRGLLSWNRLSQEFIRSQKELRTLEKEQKVLEHKINLLDTQLDMDLLDEQVRRFLDYAHPKETVIFLAP